MVGGHGNDGTDKDGRVDASAAFAEINERYYDGSPAPYFDHRLNNLMVVAAADPDYGPQLRAGLDLGGHHVVVGEDEFVASDMSPDDLRQFVTAESLILHCHAAETLLRVFIAHEGRQECPWLVIAAMDFGRLWEVARNLADEAWSSGMRAVTADLVLGGAEWFDGHPVPPDEWDRVLDRVCAWIRHLAGALLENRSHYNAAKHGFGTKVATTQMLILDTDGDAVGGHRGPSIEALTHDGWNDRERHWRLSIRSYEPPVLWAETETAIRLLESIWSIGRSRFYPGETAMLFVPAVAPSELRRSGHHTWHRTLLVEPKRPKSP